MVTQILVDNDSDNGLMTDDSKSITWIDVDLRLLTSIPFQYNYTYDTQDIMAKFII